MRDFINLIWKNRSLIQRLVERELGSRYRGLLIGKAWFILTPLLMLAVFTFVFSEIFAVRWENAQNPRALAMMLFAGLVIFQFFGELLSRAPGLILEETAYVNKAVFPLEVLSVVAVLTALANMLTSLVLLLILHVIMIGLPSLQALWLPVVIMPLLILMLGLVLLIAAVGVYIRDIRQVTPWLAQVAMFLGPVFYPLSSLPQFARALVMLNPISVIIENARAVLLFDRAPDLVLLWVYTIIATAVLFVGIVTFRALKPGFADVI